MFAFLILLEKIFQMEMNKNIFMVDKQYKFLKAHLNFFKKESTF